jgi:anti-anti-sigma factor
MDFDVISLDPDTNQVVLRGRLDAAGAEQIDLRFTAAVGAAGKHALIDCAGMEFCASMGIRMLIATARVLQRRQRRMVLYGVTPAVQDVFETVALSDLIPIVAGEPEARAKLAA